MTNGMDNTDCPARGSLTSHLRGLTRARNLRRLVTHKRTHQTLCALIGFSLYHERAMIGLADILFLALACICEVRD